MRQRYGSQFNFLILTVALICAAVGVCASCGRSSDPESPDSEAYYDMLDEELERSEVYQNRKDVRISGLKRDLAQTKGMESRQKILGNLVNEYESYISDSALYYVGLYIDNAHRMGDWLGEQEMKLREVDIKSHAGLFEDALTEISSINRQELDPSLLEQYYYVYCGLYQYLGEYSQNENSSSNYSALRLKYTDSIMHVAPENSFRNITYKSNALIVEGKTKEAIEMLRNKLVQYNQESRQYAILASILAYAYKCENNDELYNKYLVLSAISDIKSSTKENMSFRELSNTLFESGDLNRAKRYLKKSFDDANFYSARMRVSQSARMLPVIDSAYDASQHELQSRLKCFLYLLGAMSLVLVIAIVFILKQMRRIRVVGNTVSKRNQELSEISEKLKEVNTELADTNVALKQSDSIKEEYARLFMQFSSLTISNLENYHRILHNLASKGNTKELIKKIDNSNIASQTLRDFYDKFDEAILNIYPNFVEKVNALLTPDSQIILKPGCKLNTELRVLALLRLGITDSDKIAEFLRCSLTTVYTYRSKIRKRALNPDTFEDDVKNDK